MSFPPENEPQRCEDCDGDGVTGTSPDSPPCGTGAKPERTMIKIARNNWHMNLAEAIETAPREATIEVQNQAMKELAELARNRMVGATSRS